MAPDTTETGGGPLRPLAIFSLLAEGAKDMRATGYYGLVYGIVFVLMGYAIAEVYKQVWQMTMGLTAAFFLMGPFVCCGIYDLSRRLGIAHHGIGQRVQGVGVVECAVNIQCGVTQYRHAEDRLDAQIRIGGDAGASEVIVLRAYGEVSDQPESLITGLLLPDAPVVAWWPADAPAHAANSQIGAIATRRITDAASALDHRAFLANLADTYTPGDSDFAWTRLTLWRQQLAAILDQPPYDAVTGAVVTGAVDSPSTDLLAAWLKLKLKVDVEVVRVERGSTGNGIKGVKLQRTSGDIEIVRRVPDIATLIQPTQPVREVSLPRRSLRDCLSEDMRRLDPDDLFGKVIKTFKTA